MKASVAFVLLAFLSATTVTVHVQNRKASKVNSIIRNHFFFMLSQDITAPQMIPE